MFIKEEATRTELQVRVKHNDFKNRNTTKGHFGLRQKSYNVLYSYISKWMHHEDQPHYNS